MAASRAARKREMIANLENEEYINNLVEESYAIIFVKPPLRKAIPEPVCLSLTDSHRPPAGL